MVFVCTSQSTVVVVGFLECTVAQQSNDCRVLNNEMNIIVEKKSPAVFVNTVS